MGRLPILDLLPILAVKPAKRVNLIQEPLRILLWVLICMLPQLF